MAMRYSSICLRFLLIGVLFSTRSVAAHASESATGPALTIFVGKLVDVRELDYGCGENCVPFDSGFSLTYDVLENVHGQAESSQSEFHFFGHYGLPSFTHFETALVFVFRGENENVMARYLAFPVARTEDGSWAFCGDPYPDDVPKGTKRLRKIRFEKPVLLSAITAKYRTEHWQDDEHGKMKSGLSRCRAGVLAGDLAGFFAPRAEPGYFRVWTF